ncbi:DUF397 domain-containing protein [Streptomyces sp. NPDC001273]|uniref:DUF397 domain-containing protein n=1 Tax=unclassified Streptomyces TaxID=2593676 RepID=UPI000CD5C3CB|nr:DUF397 domain-containing protein [Streptomyces sp. SM1]
MNHRVDELTVPESAWFKSSYSSGEGGECIEVAETGGAVWVRDSKRPSQARLSFRGDAWSEFVKLAAG